MQEAKDIRRILEPKNWRKGLKLGFSNSDRANGMVFVRRFRYGSVDWRDNSVVTERKIDRLSQDHGHLAVH